MKLAHHSRAWIQTWRARIQDLADNLSALEVASTLGISETYAREVLHTFHYHYRDRRGEANRSRWKLAKKKVNPDKVDWRKTNAVIARQFKVSREYIRQLRNRYHERE